ncbi:MAG: DUF6171 family protein [Halanaerobiales bacterium]
MLDNRKCKSCRESNSISKKEIKRELKKIINNESLDTVKSEIYQYRLKNCQQCPALSNETTCKYNGSIVQIKAKLKKSTCPYPDRAKW